MIWLCAIGFFANSMKVNMKKFLAVFTLIACVLIIGCGKKAPYDVVPIEGTASYKGQPLPPNFRIDFQPEDGKRGSSASITEGGKFIAQHTLEQDGVPTGTCGAVVSWEGPMGTSPPQEYQPMIKKYGYGTPGLEVEITKKDKKFKLDFPE